MPDLYCSGALLENVTIDTLRISSKRVTLNGCGFRHVTLTGKCGTFLFNRDIDIMQPEKSAEFNTANDQFHAGVDWALDLRGLKATTFELRGAIPVELIRRDPEQQVIMSREIALSEDWRAFGPPNSFGVGAFLDSGSAQTLLVACARSKHFNDEMEFFAKLRSAGLVT